MLNTDPHYTELYFLLHMIFLNIVRNDGPIVKVAKQRSIRSNDLLYNRIEGKKYLISFNYINKSKETIFSFHTLDYIETKSLYTYLYGRTASSDESYGRWLIFQCKFGIEFDDAVNLVMSNPKMKSEGLLPIIHNFMPKSGSDNMIYANHLYESNPLYTDMLKCQHLDRNLNNWGWYRFGGDNSHKEYFIELFRRIYRFTSRLGK